MKTQMDAINLFDLNANFDYLVLIPINCYNIQLDQWLGRFHIHLEISFLNQTLLEQWTC